MTDTTDKLGNKVAQVDINAALKAQAVQEQLQALRKDTGANIAGRFLDQFLPRAIAEKTPHSQDPSR